jgi:hypothetical protein
MKHAHKKGQSKKCLNKFVTTLKRNVAAAFIKFFMAHKKHFYVCSFVAVAAALSKLKDSILKKNLKGQNDFIFLKLKKEDI